MKKILTVLVALVVFYSCNKSDELEVVQETGSIQAVIGTGGNQSKTKVKRGDIHSWVDEVTIKAESAETGYVIDKTFKLLDIGDNGYNNASSVFGVNKVALGLNDITATSTTDVVGLREFKVHTSGTKSDWISNHVSTTTPYAVYATDNPVRVDVKKTGTEAISLNMKTKNARLIAAISMMKNNANAQYLTDNFIAYARAEVTDAD